ncbi:6-phosphogluconolactonase [uncultured bacterium]|nr:6-phosphogluconolactonase [uncultured bacterium]
MTKVSVRYEIMVVANPDELSLRAADEFVRQAGEAVQAKGFFTVALSGGSTPRDLYMLLASDQYRERVPWSKVYVFWGDERCVSLDHPNSNYHMAFESLLDKVPIPEENIYRMPAEQKDHDCAAAVYEQTIKAFFRLKPKELPCFDLILLGMGEDGHIASLFPGSSALEETDRIVSANYIEKFSAYRLTLTVPVINQAANVMFLISGESKASILREVLEDEYQPRRLPSQLIRPVNGRLLFIVDRPAAGKLTRV